MEYFVLGPSGLRVSRLCLGTATFGHKVWGCDAGEADRILGHFLDLGGNFLDTANQYADGNSEGVLGTLLAGRRDKMVLATKYTASMDDSDVNNVGNHRKALVRSLDSSLRRLGTDYVDILWIHTWDGVTPVEELMRALDDQVRAGKVLSVGASNAPAWMIAMANTTASIRGWSPFTAVQGEYNLLERGAERDLLPMSRHSGLGFVAWAPLAQGRLTGKFEPAKTAPGRLTVDDPELTSGQKSIVDATLAVAGELACPPVAVAARWVMDRQPDVIPILGARTEAQLAESTQCLDFKLSDEQLARLTDVSEIDIGSPTSFLRARGSKAMWGERADVPVRPTPQSLPWWNAGQWWRAKDRGNPWNQVL